MSTEAQVNATVATPGNPPAPRPPKAKPDPRTTPSNPASMPAPTSSPAKIPPGSKLSTLLLTTTTTPPAPPSSRSSTPSSPPRGPAPLPPHRSPALDYQIECLDKYHSSRIPSTPPSSTVRRVSWRLLTEAAYGCLKPPPIKP